MSLEAINLVWKFSTATLGARLVILALADYANEQLECWPSVETIANKSKLSERNARVCLRKLQALGEIEIEQNDGSKGSNRYRITIDPRQGEGAKLAGAKSSRGGGKNEQTKGGANFAPKPSVEPSTVNPKEELPEILNCSRFADAWVEWKQFRAELKKKLTPSTVRLQLKFLAGLGLEGAVLSIQQSIEKGWQGLFAPKQARRLIGDVAPPPGRKRSMPPPGLKPWSTIPPPGFDKDGKEIPLAEWEKKFPLSDFYDDQTLEPCG